MIESIQDKSYFLNKKREKLSQMMYQKEYKKLTGYEKKEVNLQISNYHKWFN